MAGDYIYAQTKTTISVESGIYSVSFSTSDSCVLTLGVISVRNSADLNKLSYSVPSTFTILKQDGYYFKIDSYLISESSYFVLFYNGSSASKCFYDTFTSTVESDSIIPPASTYFNLPYGITKTFKNFFKYESLVIKSQSSSIINVNVYSDYSSSSLTTTPMSPYFKPTTVYAGSTQTVSLKTNSNYTSYIYLNCSTSSGCPVYLSTPYIRNDSESAIIGGIVGSLIFIAICLFIVFTVLIARRRMTKLAAASSPNKTITTESNESYVPVPTAVVKTPNEPGIFYGNEAYSQPVTSQPYQPMAYQPHNPYYNHVVVSYPTNVSAQQASIPAFNPNVDRV